MKTRSLVSLGLLLAASALAHAACLPANSTDDDPSGEEDTSSSSSGGSSGGDTDSDGGGGSSGEPGGDDWVGSPERPPVDLLFVDQNKEITHGSTYAKDTFDGIPPFSDGIVTLSVQNRSGAAVTVERIEINPVSGAAVLDGDVTSDEFVVNEPGNVLRRPIVIENLALEADGAFSFGVFFMPYYSGERLARVRVLTTDNREANFILRGRGRDNLIQSPNTASASEHILERIQADLMIGGLVSDSSGGVIASMNVNQMIDRYSHDIGLVAANADGSKRWAKLWNEDFEQTSPDSGQNGETGGGAESIAADATHTYVVGRRSQSSHNSVFQAFVMKVSTTDGSLGWTRGITHGANATPATANESAEAYSVDASLPDRVLVTGTFGGSANDILLVALSKADGSILFKKRIGVTGAVERGFSIRTDANGNGYIGGISGATAMLQRVTGLNGNSPELSWVRMLGIGVGGRINSMDLADNGDVLLSLDVRGALTTFSAARVSNAGQIVWAKTWAGDEGQRNNTHVVRLHNGVAYVGGRIAVKAADTVYGDGFLLALDAADGSYKSGSMYYSGKTAERSAEHRVKGLVFSGNDVFGLSHGVTVNQNYTQYWGLWYQAPDNKLELPAGNGAERLRDFPFELQAPSGDFPGLSEMNATAHVVNVANAWRDLPEDAFYGAPRGHEGEQVQNHMLLQKLTLTP